MVPRVENTLARNDWRRTPTHSEPSESKIEMCRTKRGKASGIEDLAIWLSRAQRDGDNQMTREAQR